MKTIMVCIKQRLGHNPSCAGRGSVALAAHLEQTIAEKGYSVQVHRFNCLGLCDAGPNMKVVGGELFHHVALADLPAILAEALTSDDASPPVGLA